MSWCLCVIISWCPRILVFSYPHVLISWCSCILVSSYPHVLVSLYPSVLISLCPCILMSSYPCVIISLYPVLLMSWVLLEVMRGNRCPRSGCIHLHWLFLSLLSVKGHDPFHVVCPDDHPHLCTVTNHSVGSERSPKKNPPTKHHIKSEYPRRLSRREARRLYQTHEKLSLFLPHQLHSEQTGRNFSMTHLTTSLASPLSSVRV